MRQQRLRRRNSCSNRRALCATNTALDWKPAFDDGFPGETVLFGNRIYVGGELKSIKSLPRFGFAAFGAADTAQVVP